MYKWVFGSPANNGNFVFGGPRENLIGQDVFVANTFKLSLLAKIYQTGRIRSLLS